MTLAYPHKHCCSPVSFRSPLYPRQSTNLQTRSAIFALPTQSIYCRPLAICWLCSEVSLLLVLFDCLTNAYRTSLLLIDCLNNDRCALSHLILLLRVYGVQASASANAQAWAAAEASLTARLNDSESAAAAAGEREKRAGEKLQASNARAAATAAAIHALKAELADANTGQLTCL